MSKEAPALEKNLEEYIETTLRELGVELEFAVSKFGKELIEKPYSLIIGDDASGRIATLMISGFVDKIYEKNDLAKPPIMFFSGSGGRHLTEAELESKSDEIAEKIKASGTFPVSGKVLVVTETIETGRGVLSLAKALQKLGLKFDFLSATLSMRDDTDVLPVEEVNKKSEELRSVLGAESLIYGQVGNSASNTQHGIQGVIIDHPTKIHSIPVKRFAKGESGSQQIQSSIELSRGPIKEEIVSNLVKHYEESVIDKEIEY